MSASISSRDALFIPSDYRFNAKQVIAKRSDLVQYAGGRMKPAASGTQLYNAGLVVGYAATGADAGYYKPYNDSNTDGSQTAVGVLSEDVLVDTADNGGECVIIKEGDLFQDFLIGLDAAGIVDMSGKAYIEHGTNIISIRA